MQQQTGVKLGPFKAIRHSVHSTFYRMKGTYQVAMGDEQFTCDPENWRFWRNVNRGKWEEHTLNILRTVLTKRDYYLDVGSWIGPTVIYAARFCRTVFGLEPDPVAYELLLKNIRLNNIKNVQTAQVGLYSEKKMLSLGSPQGLGTSGSSLLYGESAGAATIHCLTIEDILRYWNIEHVKLTKIDIEGAEFDILPTIQSSLLKATDAIYLSTHTPHFAQNERQGKMRQLHELFAQASYIYDDKFKLISAKETENSEYLNRYSEFLLSRTAL